MAARAQALLDLYGEGLAHIVEEVAARDDGTLAEAFAGDELVSQLLLLHGLHPVPLEDRVRGALEEVVPYLGSHGGGVELLGIEDGVVRLALQGTCDGCALGTKGMRDWTTRQVHLCNVRLRLLRLNTMPALDTALLADVAPLAGKRSAQLRDLGRLPYPMLRRRGEPGFTRTGWDDALDLIAGRIRASTPERLGVYLTSRGTPNETYFAAQKAVRAMGTNSVDNAARVCHAPSTLVLKETIGAGATTVSYADVIGTDLVVLIGSNVANTSRRTSAVAVSVPNDVASQYS